VKSLKLGIVVLGALGLAGMFLTGLGDMLADRKGSTIVMLIAFALPVVMAGTGLVKPPQKVWQAGVSLACFALTLFKLRIWDTIKVIDEVPTGVKLMLASAVLGTIMAAIAALRPDRAATS
jgi:nitrate/nitrite transporter NarK